MMKSLKIIALSVLILALVFSVTNCCVKCCSPSIEVGLCDPAQIRHGCSDFQILTWDPITRFPRNPNVLVSGSSLQALRPYLFKTKVTNFSDVDVRGVTVVYYWAAFGLFDRGTPIGAVGVDLKANESKWVRSPWSFALKSASANHLCVSVRVFHPCDKVLDNNYCWRNLQIIRLKWPLEFYMVPFVVNFREFEGKLRFEINAPNGIDVRIIDKTIEKKGVVETIPAAKTLDSMTVKANVTKELSLLVINKGADYKSGDKFKVTVRAYKGKKETSSFTVQFEVQ
jgi:hypothetical protein